MQSTEIAIAPPARETYLGSGDIASIFGVDDAFGSPYSVWARKTGNMPPQEVTEPMRVGLVLEDYILDRYSEEEKVQIASRQAFFRHPDWDFLGCTADGIVIGPDGKIVRIIEAKSTRDFKWTEVPLRYEAQVQWLMGISGVGEADLTVLHRTDLQLNTYRLQFNPAIFAALEERAIDFWFTNVKAGVAPPVDCTESTTEALKHIAAVPAKEVAIDALSERLAALEVIKAQIKEAESQKELIENEVRNALGDAEIGLINGQKAVTWKSQKTTRLDSKLLKSESPEIFEKYQVTTESRVLRITKGGK